MNISSRRFSLLKASLILFTCLSLVPNLKAQAGNSPSSGDLGYFSDQAQQRVYLQTDRNFYLSGEIIWYKLHLREADFAPAQKEQVAYIELWDQEKVLLKQQIGLSKGKGHGSMYLPLYLNSGEYILRAYSSAGLAHAGQHYECKVRIANTFNEQKTPKQLAPALSADVLPEGGQAVLGLPARYGIKLQHESGGAVAFEAALLNEKNDTLQRFTSHKFGLAQLSFTPDSGRYRIWFQTADTSLIASLPPAQTEGVVMQVEPAEDNYELKLYRSHAASFKKGQLLVHSAGKLRYQTTVEFNGKELQLSIPRQELGEGVSRITLFDEQLNPRAERVVFEQPRQRLPLQVELSASEIGTRESLQLKIQSSAGSSLSLAAVRSNDLIQAPEDNILTALWLSNDLKGNIDSAHYYFGPLNEQRQMAISNLMLTHGWRSFKTKEKTAKQASAWKGQRMQVKVKDANGKPAADLLMYLSVPGKDFQFYSARTNSEGIATLYTDRLQGQQRIVMVAAEAEGKGFQFEVLDPFFSRPPRLEPSDFYIAEEHAAQLADLSLNMQTLNVFAKEEVNAIQTPTEHPLRFFGTPDIAYRLDDYTRFPTMEEVLREYVREVQVRNNGDDYQLRMFYDVDERFFDSEPLRLIDGVPVYSSNKIIDYDPLQVEKLAIIDNRFIVGADWLNGVLSLTTYEGDAEVEALNPQAVVTRYAGLADERIFYSPRYSKPDTLQHKPDFRNLLFWTPEVELNEKGAATVEFFSGDRPGRYLIQLEGIDKQGRAAVSQHYFEVKEKPGL